MRKAILLFFIFVAFFAGIATTRASKVKAQVSIEETRQNIACIGESVAGYMNTVIAESRGLQNIRLLSPAFNFTHPFHSNIIQAMRENNANFAGLYAISGNAYNTSNGVITDFVRTGLGPIPGNKPVFLTETGMYEIGQGVPRAQALDRFRTQVGLINANPRYIGAAIFNVFGENPAPWFAYNLMNDTEINIVCGGNCSKIGANHAVFYNNPINMGRIQNTGMRFSVFIIDNNLAGVENTINSLPSGVTPVLRIGVGGDALGFENPRFYAAFLQALDSRVNRTVYAIAGPNEPDAEDWVWNWCAGLGDPDDIPPWPDPGTVPPGTVGTPTTPNTTLRVGQACVLPYDSNYTRNEEFYSMRPYPACPWNQARDVRYYQCSNDLVATDRFEVAYPAPQAEGVDLIPGSCITDTAGTTDPNDDTITCNYTVDRTVNVAVDMSATKLPIMGLTQNPASNNPLPNDRITNAHATYAQKVNEYVNWYLQGVFGRAEDPLLNMNEDGLLSGADSGGELLVNYSGPLKKLLPWDSLTLSRRGSIDVVGEGNTTPATNPRGQHDQIVGCTADVLGIGDFPVPCYGEYDLSDFIQDYLDRIPQLFSHITEPRQRLLAYIQWTRENVEWNDVRELLREPLTDLIQEFGNPQQIFCSIIDYHGLDLGVGMACGVVASLTNIQADTIADLLLGFTIQLPLPALPDPSFRFDGLARPEAILSILEWILSGCQADLLAGIPFLPVELMVSTCPAPDAVEDILAAYIQALVTYFQDQLGSIDIVDIERHRISEWRPGFGGNANNDHYPEIFNNGEDYSNYWRDYLRWRGEFCSPVVYGYYLCFDDRGVFGQNNYWADIFPNMPLTGPMRLDESVVTTEDRIGIARGEVATIQPDSQVRMNDNGVTFEPENGQDGRFTNLFFAHMQAVDQLGELLQGTFVPQGTDSLGALDTRPQYNTNRCEILESRTNAGDNLYGNAQTEFDTIGIQGDMRYQGEFSCTFRTNGVSDTICYDACDQSTACGVLGSAERCTSVDTCDVTDNTWQPNSSCSAASGGGCCRPRGFPLTTCRQQCSRCPVSASVAMSVFTTTPSAGEVWNRLVNGPMSIFKRIFPHVGADTPVSEIENIPARSQAVYRSETTGVTVTAGDPGVNRPGSEAQVFFPYLGSVYDYFMQGIQTALRPYGMVNSGTGVVGQTPIIPSTSFANCPAMRNDLPEPGTGIVCEPINCLNIPDETVALYDARFLGEMKAQYIDLADRWVHNGNTNADECYNDVVMRSFNAGINPLFSLAIWLQESASSTYNGTSANGAVITSCDPRYPNTTIQDFGINRPSMAGNFDAQIKQFLRLPYLYPNQYPNCFTNGCNMENFAQIYQQGVPSSGACVPNRNAIFYANKTYNTMNLFAPGCRPTYPTDMNLDCLN